MSPAERVIYDLVDHRGMLTAWEILTALGSTDILDIHRKLRRLEAEGWLRSQPHEVTDPERLKERRGHHQRVYSVARREEEDRR